MARASVLAMLPSAGIPRAAALGTLASLALGACANGQEESLVLGVQNQQQSRALAGAIAGFVAANAEPGSVALAPVAEPRADGVTPALSDLLRRGGYPIAHDGQAAHQLRYLATPLERGELLRMDLDDATRGAQFFARLSGELVPAAPLSVGRIEAGDAP